MSWEYQPSWAMMFSSSTSGWSRIARAYATASDDSSRPVVARQRSCACSRNSRYSGGVHPRDRIECRTVAARSAHRASASAIAARMRSTRSGTSGGSMSRPAIEERLAGMVGPVRVGSDDQHPEAVARH